MELPKTMLAVQLKEQGGPEVLELREVPVPEVGPNDALIRVNHCALNHLDIFVRAGMPGWQIPLPHIPGSDVSGIVAAAGSEAHNIVEGMECFVHPGVPGQPSLERLRGDDNMAADYDILGLFSDGGYAQYVKVKADCVFPKPTNISFTEAAAMPLTFLTAWHMLGPKRANLQQGETVLVIGGNSGVGSAAIQIARERGCRVIATVGNAQNAKKAQELGADDTLDHYEHAGNIHKQVFELTGGHGVHVVVEHVGKAVFDQCLKALKKGGRLVTCGATTGPKAEVNLNLVFAKHLTIMGSFMGGMHETLEYLPLVRRGQLKPVVDRVFPLAEAAEAHRYLEDGNHFGKVVLEIE